MQYLIEKLYRILFDQNSKYRMKLRISEKFFRSKKILKFKKKLINNNFSLISSDCVGGLIYHDLGIRFNSPTINMAIPAHDFVKFCENLEYYFTVSPIEDENKQNELNVSYPILRIDDINLHCIHYSSANDAIKKWEERKKRVNYNNIFMLFTAKDGFDESLLARIDKLKYNKVLFSNKKYNYSWCCYLPDFSGKDVIGDITRYKNIFGVKYYESHLDYIKWLNGDPIEKSMF